MQYYISYAICKDPKFPGGHHAFLAITELPEPHSCPKIIFRVGFMNTVILEDHVTDQPGRAFFHKTYAISQEQLDMFFKQLNDDRRLNVIPERMSTENRNQLI